MTGFSIERDKKGDPFRMVCPCGCERPVRRGRRYAASGCIHRTHGLSARTPEYVAWSHAKQRCFAPTHRQYPDYGGRGITMCDEWRADFAVFLRDMGPKPSPKHTLDRINNDGNYKPGNCRWATWEEQLSNTRHNRLVTYGGETLTIARMARKHGLKPHQLRTRIEAGWTIEDALTVPIGTTCGAFVKREFGAR